jgi:hypothetical protein
MAYSSEIAISWRTAETAFLFLIRFVNRPDLASRRSSGRARQ